MHSFDLIADAGRRARRGARPRLSHPAPAASRPSSATCSPGLSSARTRRDSSPTSALAEQLAELGVILLMFGVGLQFHRRGAAGGPAGGHPGRHRAERGRDAAGRRRRPCLRLELAAGLVFGLAMSVASTVVLIRVLADNHDAPHARRAHRRRLARGRGHLHRPRARAAARAVRAARGTGKSAWRWR